jgi:hypothetical protein
VRPHVAQWSIRSTTPEGYAGVQTDRIVSIRFTFFLAQLVCSLGIAAVVIAHAR